MSRLALHLVDAELDAFAVADDIKWKQLAARTEAERKQRAVMPKQGTPHLWVFWLHPGELVADLEAIVDDRIDADREDDALPLRVARWTDSQTLGAVLDTPRDDRSEQADISKLDMLARTAEHRLRGTGGWAHERRRPEVVVLELPVGYRIEPTPIHWWIAGAGGTAELGTSSRPVPPSDQQDVWAWVLNRSGPGNTKALGGAVQRGQVMFVAPDGSRRELRLAEPLGRGGKPMGIEVHDEGPVETRIETFNPFLRGPFPAPGVAMTPADKALMRSLLFHWAGDAVQELQRAQALRIRSVDGVIEIPRDPDRELANRDLELVWDSVVTNHRSNWVGWSLGSGASTWNDIPGHSPGDLRAIWLWTLRDGRPAVARLEESFAEWKLRTWGDLWKWFEKKGPRARFQKRTGPQRAELAELLSEDLELLDAALSARTTGASLALFDTPGGGVCAATVKDLFSTGLPETGPVGFALREALDPAIDPAQVVPPWRTLDELVATDRERLLRTPIGHTVAIRARAGADVDPNDTVTFGRGSLGMGYVLLSADAPWFVGDDLLPSEGTIETADLGADWEEQARWVEHSPYDTPRVVEAYRYGPELDRQERPESLTFDEAPSLEQLARAVTASVYPDLTMDRVVVCARRRAVVVANLPTARLRRRGDDPVRVEVTVLPDRAAADRFAASGITLRDLRDQVQSRSTLSCSDLPPIALRYLEKDGGAGAFLFLGRDGSAGSFPMPLRSELAGELIGLWNGPDIEQRVLSVVRKTAKAVPFVPVWIDTRPFPVVIPGIEVTTSGSIADVWERVRDAIPAALRQLRLGRDEEEHVARITREASPDRIVAVRWDGEGEPRGGTLKRDGARGARHGLGFEVHADPVTDSDRRIAFWDADAEWDEATLRRPEQTAWLRRQMVAAGASADGRLVAWELLGEGHARRPAWRPGPAPEPLSFEQLGSAAQGTHVQLWLDLPEPLLLEIDVPGTRADATLADVWEATRERLMTGTFPANVNLPSAIKNHFRHRQSGHERTQDLHALVGKCEPGRVLCVGATGPEGPAGVVRPLDQAGDVVVTGGGVGFEVWAPRREQADIDRSVARQLCFFRSIGDLERKRPPHPVAEYATSTNVKDWLPAPVLTAWRAAIASHTGHHVHGANQRTGPWGGGVVRITLHERGLVRGTWAIFEDTQRLEDLWQRPKVSRPERWLEELRSEDANWLRLKDQTRVIIEWLPLQTERNTLRTRIDTLQPKTGPAEGGTHLSTTLDSWLFAWPTQGGPCALMRLVDISRRPVRAQAFSELLRTAALEHLTPDFPEDLEAALHDWNPRALSVLVHWRADRKGTSWVRDLGTLEKENEWLLLEVGEWGLEVTPRQNMVRTIPSGGVKSIPFWDPGLGTIDPPKGSSDLRKLPAVISGWTRQAWALREDPDTAEAKTSIDVFPPKKLCDRRPDYLPMRVRNNMLSAYGNVPVSVSIGGSRRKGDGYWELFPPGDIRFRDDEWGTALGELARARGASRAAITQGDSKQQIGTTIFLGERTNLVGKRNLWIWVRRAAAVVLALLLLALLVWGTPKVLRAISGGAGGGDEVAWMSERATVSEVATPPSGWTPGAGAFDGQAVDGAGAAAAGARVELIDSNGEVVGTTAAGNGGWFRFPVGTAMPAGGSVRITPPGGTPGSYVLPAGGGMCRIEVP